LPRHNLQLPLQSLVGIFQNLETGIPRSIQFSNQSIFPFSDKTRWLQSSELEFIHDFFHGTLNLGHQSLDVLFPTLQSFFKKRDSILHLVDKSLGWGGAVDSRTWDIPGAVLDMSQKGTFQGFNFRARFMCPTVQDHVFPSQVLNFWSCCQILVPIFPQTPFTIGNSHLEVLDTGRIGPQLPLLVRGELRLGNFHASHPRSHIFYGLREGMRNLAQIISVHHPAGNGTQLGLHASNLSSEGVLGGLQIFLDGINPNANLGHLMGRLTPECPQTVFGGPESLIHGQNAVAHGSIFLPQMVRFLVEEIQMFLDLPHRGG
jgi:hypothetical protein